METQETQETQEVKVLKKGGKVEVKNAVVSIEYSMEYDKDNDGRPSAGIAAKAFVDLPEILDESLKDNATAQLLAKWFDSNKTLLPPVEKEL